ncbi:hypothetical protein CC79DRAFT_1074963 [Sarocladium strictum]
MPTPPGRTLLSSSRDATRSHRGSQLERKAARRKRSRLAKEQSIRWVARWAWVPFTSWRMVGKVGACCVMVGYAIGRRGGRWTLASCGRGGASSYITAGGGLCEGGGTDLLRCCSRETLLPLTETFQSGCL